MYQKNPEYCSQSKSTCWYTESKCTYLRCTHPPFRSHSSSVWSQIASCQLVTVTQKLQPSTLLYRCHSTLRSSQGRHQASGSIYVFLGCFNMLPFKNQVLVSFYVTDGDLDCCVPNPIVPIRPMFLLHDFATHDGC